MEELRIFNYEGREVRTVRKDGKPRFVLEDVCGALGIADPADALVRLNADELARLDSGGSSGECDIINENGIYSVMQKRSDKPGTMQFKRWVLREVLPALKKKTKTAPADKKEELQIFTNGEFGELGILEIDGKPYFPATKRSEVLGYSDPYDAVARHTKGSVKHRVLTGGGEQEIKMIPEGDLYRLIIRSKLPSAERFERWVFDEVLPPIRRNGGYSAPVKTERALIPPKKLIDDLNRERAKRAEIEDDVFKMNGRIVKLRGTRVSLENRIGWTQDKIDALESAVAAIIGWVQKGAELGRVDLEKNVRFLAWDPGADGTRGE